MKFPKPKRPKDKKLLDYIKTLGCVVCGLWPSDADHIGTRGSGAGDSWEGVWPLCRNCHIKRHQLGLTGFVERFPTLENELKKRGWHYDNTLRKWRRNMDQAAERTKDSNK